MIKLKPKAKHLFCWICSRKLYAGGRWYVEMVGDDGRTHPVHQTCKDEHERSRGDELRERWGIRDE